MPSDQSSRSLHRGTLHFPGCLKKSQAQISKQSKRKWLKSEIRKFKLEPNESSSKKPMLTVAGNAVEWGSGRRRPELTKRRLTVRKKVQLEPRQNKRS